MKSLSADDLVTVYRRFISTKANRSGLGKNKTTINSSLSRGGLNKG